jgi:hypothetical protein
MQIKDIAFDETTRRLLEENGRLDCNAGKSMYDGWNEICIATGYSRGRTPAREAYEDGYFRGTPPKRDGKSGGQHPDVEPGR